MWLNYLSEVLQSRGAAWHCRVGHSIHIHGWAHLREVTSSGNSANEKRRHLVVREAKRTNTEWRRQVRARCPRQQDSLAITMSCCCLFWWVNESVARVRVSGTGRVQTTEGGRRWIIWVTSDARSAPGTRAALCRFCACVNHFFLRRKTKRDYFFAGKMLLFLLLLPKYVYWSLFIGELYWGKSVFIRRVKLFPSPSFSLFFVELKFSFVSKTYRTMKNLQWDRLLTCMARLVFEGLSLERIPDGGGGL